MCKAVERAAQAGKLGEDLPGADDIEDEFEALRPTLEREAGLVA
jgi:hypothetical protein